MDSRSILASIFLMLPAFLMPQGALGEVYLDEEEVVFRLVQQDARRVFIAGDFNGWNPTLDRMASRDGEFEIRLYLVPGKYRYAFIVDGRTMPDPDNTNIDSGGNTFFILRESAGGYELVFGGAGGITKDTEGLDVEASLSVDAVVSGGDGTAFLSPELRGKDDGPLSLYVKTGFELGTEGKGDAKGYLVRSEASYVSDKVDFRAFHRADTLDFGDPLGILGETGPYRYPIGIFCRGIGMSGRFPFGIKGEIFYASRISGFGTGLDIGPGGQDTGTEIDPDEIPFLNRVLEDSDIVGTSIGGTLGPLEIVYLMRRDLRPGGRRWFDTSYPGCVFSGTEELIIHGGWVRSRINDWVSIDAEYLDGSTRLVSTEMIESESGSAVPFEYGRDWESGGRLHVGLSLTGGRLSLALSAERTTISGDKSLRAGRDGDMLRGLRAETEFSAELFSIFIRASEERYSAEDGSGIFLFQRRNFWLDGDRIEPAFIPLIGSKGFYRIEAGICEQPADTIYKPYSMDGRFSLDLVGDRYRSGRKIIEMRASKGFPLLDRLSGHFDLRFVSYRDDRWTGEKDFFDAWLALCARLPRSSWCAVGLGVAPHSFDRWIFGYTGYSREKRLFENGVLQAVASGDDTAMLEALIGEERSMSTDWNLTFEAGVSW